MHLEITVGLLVVAVFVFYSYSATKMIIAEYIKSAEQRWKQQEQLKKDVEEYENMSEEED